VIALENGQGVVLVDADEHHGAIVFADAQAIAQGLNFGDEAAGLAAEALSFYALNNVAEQKTTVRNFAPLSAGEDADFLQVFGFNLDLPPLGIRRKFTPHVSATAEEKRAPDGVLTLVAGVGVEHERFEALAVMVELALVELILQEVVYDFVFGDALQLLHAAP
jgi:hypothetical protein